MNEVVREFILETTENLAQMDQDLVTLEKDPYEREALGRAFRALHTIKGTAGFMGELPKLQALAHAGENLLSKLRDGAIIFNKPIASALLEVVDAIRRMLTALEVCGDEGEAEYDELIQTLERLTTGSSAPGDIAARPPDSDAGSAASSTVPPPPAPHALIHRDSVSVVYTSGGPKPPQSPAPAPPPPHAVEVPTPPPPPPPKPVQKAPVPEPPTPPVPPPGTPHRLIHRDSVSVVYTGEQPLPTSPAPASPPLRAGEVPTPIARPPQAPAVATPVIPIVEPTAPMVEVRAPAVSDTAIRVDVGLLDKLMNLVGELVLARNQILQASASQEDTLFLNTVQRLNQLTTELQANVMKTRMQPIHNIWSKFPRVVRDLAVACGKEVRMEMDGQDTELDRTIIEAIRDPLTHLLRNSVDHGIELPAERVAAGKPVKGRLALHASHEGGKVIIEISDDGGGIDPQRVRDKAVAAKLISLDQAVRMTDAELINLVFVPGFTTVDRITQFSGRGVGMDVVRTHIEKVGGTVSINSRLGRGTTVKMKIPLTLAIIPALTIASGGDRYAIPQVNLLELVHLEGDQAKYGIELIHGVPVYRLRGNLLPIVYLNHILGLEEPGTGPVNGGINVVVLQADERQFGLVVDAIHDTEEIVVKPLQKQLKSLNAFAGATIMGDGKVALILDVLGLAQRANVLSGVRERGLGGKRSHESEEANDRESVLLFTTHDGARLAMPLSDVARLEEFPRSAIERIGSQEVVQYREEILPLINLPRALRAMLNRDGTPDGIHKKKRANGRTAPRTSSSNGDDRVQVVVYAGKAHQVGLIVERILDIVEETITTRTRATRPGILFAAVIQGRVTEFLDIEGLLQGIDLDFLAPA
jgi:two-component system chemotaxis sensor kinase CheA